MAHDSNFTVVIGIDGSANSRKAVEWGMAHVAANGGGVVKLVMAWAYPPMQAIGFGMGGMIPDVTSMNEANQEALDHLMSEFEPPDGVTLVGVGAEGGAAHAILQAAENADMIVVGKRGHGGLVGMLIGSVATQVANHASCPVAIIPAEPEH